MRDFDGSDGPKWTAKLKKKKKYYIKQTMFIFFIYQKCLIECDTSRSHNT